MLRPKATRCHGPGNKAVYLGHTSTSNAAPREVLPTPPPPLRISVCVRLKLHASAGVSKEANGYAAEECKVLAGSPCHPVTIDLTVGC